MNLKTILLFLSVFTLISSCSSNKKTEEAKAPEEVAVADDDSDFIVDSDDEELTFEDEKQSENEVADIAEESAKEEDLVVDESTKEEAIAEVAAPMESMDEGEVDSYTVEKGDTLMYIAFKKLGNYKRWREISRINNGIVTVKHGMVINVRSESFSWSPKGVAYLIKGGDTLGTISKDKYGTNKKWKSIWENNKPMIKDPNLIFAGFSLYYVPDDRDIASKM